MGPDPRSHRFVVSPDTDPPEQPSPPTSPVDSETENKASIAEWPADGSAAGAVSLEDQVARLEALVARLRRESIGTELLAQRVVQFEAELKILRTEKRNADLEIVELQALLRTAQTNLQALQNTVSYRLGRIFVNGFTSWRGLLAFPQQLSVFLWRHFGSSLKQRGVQQPHAMTGASRQSSAVSEALSEVRRNGPEQAARWARSQNFEPPLLARILLEIARVVRKTDVNMAIALGKEGISLAPSEQRIKWLAFALADAGAITEPAELLRNVIEHGVALNGTEARRADELFSLARIAKGPLSIPPRRMAVRKSRSRRALIVASRSLPYHWTAATMRLHATALALKQVGWTAEIVTLPGYPVRDGDDKPVRDLHGSVAGVSYHRLPAAVVSPHTVDLYIGEAAAMIAKVAADLDVAAIHAPSDFLTAHAALTAARMIDVPFVLDHSERVPEIALASVEVQQGERFRLFQTLQRVLAAEADAVIARTGVLRQMLVNEGIADSTVRAGFDSAVLSQDKRPRPGEPPRPAALTDRKVIGFIGEASAEFDLNLLPALLAKAGESVALHVVGTGSQFERLQSVARELGVSDRLSLPGRPKLPDIGRHYDMMDVVVLPYRSRSWRAPYELVEAMAHGACVVCPEFADIRELVGDAGVIVPHEALADTVIELLNDDDRRARLANLAKSRAAEHFDLGHLGHCLFQVYVQAWKRAGGVVGAASVASDAQEVS